MNNSSFFLMSPSIRPFLFIVWAADLALRGIALYKSARKGQNIWFVALLLINSMGILPIIYFVLQKDIVFNRTPKAVTKKTNRKGK